MPPLRMLQFAQRLGDLAVVTMLFAIAMLLAALCGGCGHTLEGTVSAARHGLSGAAHAAEFGSAKFAGALDEARAYCEDLGIPPNTDEARTCMGPIGDKAQAFTDDAKDFRALYDSIADDLELLEELAGKLDKAIAEVAPK